MKRRYQHNAKQGILAAARKKLQCRAGDSFAEVLVAILIAALAASLLATMVTVSANVTMTNETRLSALHAAESGLATLADITQSNPNVTITYSPSAGSPFTVSPTITLYSKDEFIRYEAKAAANG